MSRAAAAPTPPRASSAKHDAFDAEGVHSLTGTRLDPSGFNWKGWNEDGTTARPESLGMRGWQRDGKHKDTGTQVAPDGLHKTVAVQGKPQQKLKRRSRRSPQGCG